MEIDRLSALPESLLFDILERLGMKEAAKTAALSKQWRFLWTNLPFQFSDPNRETAKIQTFVATVDAVLALRRGPALRTFCISFHCYGHFVSDLDSWLDFAAKNQVKNLSLNLKCRLRDQNPPPKYALPPLIYSVPSLTLLKLKNCALSTAAAVEWRLLEKLILKKVVVLPAQAIGEILTGCPVLRTFVLKFDYGSTFITLPQVVYSKSSLTVLKLKNCVVLIAETTAVELRCVKKLSLENVGLRQRAVEKIVSGCPNLETMTLNNCGGFTGVEIVGRSFRRLKVKNCNNHVSLLKITAPHMRRLDMGVSFGKVSRKVLLEDVPSLELARVDFFERGWPFVEYVKLFNEDRGPSDVGFVEIDKGSMYVEAILRSAMEIFGDLRHVKCLHLSKNCNKVVSMMAEKGWVLPQLGVKDLQIGIGGDSPSVYGVVAILNSCPYLEKLFVFIYGHKPRKVSINWGPVMNDLNCDLLHLKNVELVDFVKTDVCDEPASTLAHILLKRCPVLEEVVIKSPSLSTQKVHLIKNKLLNCPKSSMHASIKFRKIN